MGFVVTIQNDMALRRAASRLQCFPIFTFSSYFNSGSWYRCSI